MNSTALGAENIKNESIIFISKAHKKFYYIVMPHQAWMITRTQSSPLKLDHIEFGDYSYQEITSKEKLLEVLSYLLRGGDFSQYAEKTILNNVYMDLPGKKPVFKEIRTAIERNNIFAAIKRHAKKLKPQYNGDI